MNKALIGELGSEELVWLGRNPGVASKWLCNLVKIALAAEKVREARSRDLLRPIRDRHYPGDEKFSYQQSLFLSMMVGRPFVRCDGEFKGDIESAVLFDVPASHLFVSTIKSGDRDVPYATEPELRAKVGANKALNVAEAFRFLEWVPDLSCWYAFHVTVRDRVVWLTASWHGGWYLCATRTGYPEEIRNGGCLVTRGLPGD